jgi:hypothetical protein
MKSTTLVPLFRSSPLLTASLVLNLMLGGLALGLWQRSNQAQMKSVPIVAPAPSTEKKQAAPIIKTQTFQWSQLDAPDFDTFVKNLRGIGCPEATIRDIVAGELTEIYAGKHQQVARTQQPGTEHAMQAEWKRLDTELEQLLARLVSAPAAKGSHGQASSRSGGIAATTATPGEASESKTTAAAAPETANNPTAGIPAAFLVGNAPEAVTEPGTLPMTVTDPTLDAGTAEQLNQMRAQFAEALQQEAAGQDAASPLYRQRWFKVQRDQDEFFSSMYGGDSFVRVQLEAMQKAATGK